MKYYSRYKLTIVIILSMIVFFFSDSEIVYEWGDIVNSLLNQHQYYYQNRPSAYMPPLYPFLLAGFKFIFSGYGVKVLHAVLFGAAYYVFTRILELALTIINLKKLETRNLISKIILVAPMAFFFYPPVAFGYLNVSVFPVSTLLFLLFIYTLGLIHTGYKLKSFIFLGIISGFMTLARSEFFYVGFVILFVYLILSAKKINGILLSRMLMYTLGLFLIVAPWLIRNKVTLGEPVLSTAKYYNLWRGNNLDQSTIPITPEGYYTNIDFPHQFTELQQEAFLKVEFEKYTKENKGHFIIGILKKVRNFLFSYYPQVGVNQYHGGLMKYLFIPWCIILVITFFFFLRNRFLRTHPFFLTLVASYIIYAGIHGLTQVLPRYNLQYLIVFIILNYASLMLYYAKKNEAGTV